MELPGALSYERTVSRSEVHVRGLSEVFIADSERTGPQEFVTALQIPRTHELWGDRLTDCHDPVITLEIGRQTVFHVLHHYYEVPRDWKFVLRRIDFRVLDLDAYRDDRVVPPEGTARVRLVSKTQSHGILEAGFDGDVTIGGTPAMVMSAEITVLSPYNYTLLRAKGRGRMPPDAEPPLADPRPVAPGLVGRSAARNVVLHEPEAGAEDDDGRMCFGLIVDQGHPAFFDHPHDHVTGSLILELYRQAAIATASRADALPSARAVVTACSMTFEEFAELDALTECETAVTRIGARGDVAVDLWLRQFGETIAQAQLQISEAPAAERAAQPFAAAPGT
jgi:A-factor biosynthesis hotdog domain